MAFDSTEVHWKDLEVFIEGQRVVKITGFKESPKAEKEYIYGASDEPLDIQPGNREYPGVITLYKSQVDAMNRAARLKGGRDLMDIKWTVVANYKATATSPRQTNTYIIDIEGYEEGMEQNAKSVPISLAFKSMPPTRV